tara:strand:- start:233 stop:484 length:252 start_codon:yes stop_codon:yes gene_type:complete
VPPHLTRIGTIRYPTRWAVSKSPFAKAYINSYMSALENLSGVEPVTAQSLRAVHIGQNEMVELSSKVSDIIDDLVSSMNTANN